MKSSVVFVWDLFRAFRLQACLSCVFSTTIEILEYSYGTSISCCKEPHYAGRPAHASLAPNTSENSPSTLTLSNHVSVPFGNPKTCARDVPTQVHHGGAAPRWGAQHTETRRLQTHTLIAPRCTLAPKYTMGAAPLPPSSSPPFSLPSSLPSHALETHHN